MQTSRICEWEYPMPGFLLKPLTDTVRSSKP